MGRDSLASTTRYHFSGAIGHRRDLSDVFPGAPPGLGMGGTSGQPKGLWGRWPHSSVCLAYGRALRCPRKEVPMDCQLVLGTFLRAAAGVALSYSLFFL